MKKYLLLLFMSVLLAQTGLYAKTFTFAKIHKMPKSIEKDYYIWRFLLQKRTSKKEAKRILPECSHLNKKLRTAYRKKTGLKAVLATPLAPRLEHSWKRRSKANKHFKKALSLLKRKKTFQAVGQLTSSYEYYSKPFDRDKSSFWLYLATNNSDYIKRLRRSKDINIYTLMAADSVNGKYPKSITSSPWKDRSYGFNIEDPIAWAKVKNKMHNSDDIDDLASNYKSKASIGVYTYLKAKACNYTKAYFPMPYRNVMKYMTPQRQALIYAIARQESRFVPASVSRSFALGMMQFMPFLIEHIAKQKGEKIDLDEIFNPYKAIDYADTHLDYLNTHLQHPLFVAYAYNAGIGFTRRHLRNRSHFRKGAYEPYMSMETMQNYEAKVYGKKVLANYVIYLNKLGVPTRIFSLLKILATPSKTDTFRR